MVFKVEAVCRVEFKNKESCDFRSNVSWWLYVRLAFSAISFKTYSEATAWTRLRFPQHPLPSWSFLRRFLCRIVIARSWLNPYFFLICLFYLKQLKTMVLFVIVCKNIFCVQKEYWTWPTLNESVFQLSHNGLQLSSLRHQTCHNQFKTKIKIRGLLYLTLSLWEISPTCSTGRAQP